MTDTLPSQSSQQDQILPTGRKPKKKRGATRRTITLGGLHKVQRAKIRKEKQRETDIWSGFHLGLLTSKLKDRSLSLPFKPPIMAFLVSSEEYSLLISFCAYLSIISSLFSIPTISDVFTNILLNTNSCQCLWNMKNFVEEDNLSTNISFFNKNMCRYFFSRK